MEQEDQGVTASPPGHQPTASALRASQSGVPNAVRCGNRYCSTGDCETCRRLKAEQAMIEALTDISPRLGFYSDREIDYLRAACRVRHGDMIGTESLFSVARAGVIIYQAKLVAQGGEARQGGDACGSVHEHPVAEGHAPND